MNERSEIQYRGLVAKWPDLSEAGPVADSTTRKIPGALQASNLCEIVQPWDDARFPGGNRAIIEPKLDGIRCIYLGGADPMFLTREGQQVRLAGTALPAMKNIESYFGKPMMFDTELVAGSFEDTLSAFRRGSGNFNLWAFDAVPLDVWQHCGISAPLRERKRMLQQAMMAVQTPVVGMLGYFTADLGGAVAAAESFWAKGIEGIVVKDSEGPYRRENSTWMKLKQQLDMTVTCIGRNAPAVLVVKMPDDKVFRLAMTGRANRDLLAQRGDCVGHRLDITYQGLTEAGLPRHAVFKRFRDELYQES